MKLSNSQYKFFTRLGLVLAIAAALCYDRVDAAYQPAFIALAIVAGVVGFFPLFTSRTFESNEDSETAAGSLSVCESAPLVVATPPNEIEISDRSLDRYIQHVYSTVNTQVQLQESFSYINNLSKVVPNIVLGSYVIGGFQNVRAERIQEMCEVVSKLGSIPQEFSVELNSEGSIIVHCQPAADAHTTESKPAEKWHWEEGSGKEELVH